MASKLTENYLPELIALGFRRRGPSMVTVNVTPQCDQRCIYCEIGMDVPSKATKRITRDDLYWVIDQMELNKIHRISLCGGEPFLFHGLLDVIGYAWGKGIRCTVTTNGMRIHRLSRDETDLLRRCQTGINVSIDSFDPSTEEMLRGIPSALQEALASISMLREQGIPVTMLTVISEYNYRELFGNLFMAWEYGIRQVLFQPVICSSNYPDREVLAGKSELNVPQAGIDLLMHQLRMILAFEFSHRIKTNVYRILPWIRQYLEAAGNPDGVLFFRHVLRHFYCREVDAIIDISYDGGIQPCGLTLSEISIHDHPERGLVNLWEEATAGLRKELDAGRFPSCCNDCCHHFSRNMVASAWKYPVENRSALGKILPLIVQRVLAGLWKNLLFINRKV